MMVHYINMTAIAQTTVFTLEPNMFLPDQVKYGVDKVRK